MKAHGIKPRERETASRMVVLLHAIKPRERERERERESRMVVLLRSRRFRRRKPAWGWSVSVTRRRLSADCRAFSLFVAQNHHFGKGERGFQGRGLPLSFRVSVLFIGRGTQYFRV